MDRFTVLDGIVVPMDRANVDTDAILPKQFMKSIERTGFGPYLFDAWRYLDAGEPGMDCTARPSNPAFALNAPRYAGASILLARANFGCGSSREHAPWALRDFGIRALVAPSFADIFRSNCFKNGLLPIELDAAQIDALFAETDATPGFRLRIDLEARSIVRPDGGTIAFDVDPHRRRCLLEGLDDIGVTLAAADRIRAHEAARRAREPWLFT
jgi:3-isopropylmalate/(R)-2-methylmalate dehydratase small subunit